MKLTITFFWVHRVCDLAPPHWSLRAVFILEMNGSVWFSFLFIAIALYTHTHTHTHSYNSSPLMYFFPRFFCFTQTHTKCTFLPCLWIIGHTHILSSIFLLYHMYAREMQKNTHTHILLVKQKKLIRRRYARNPGIHLPGIMCCIDLTPIQYALVFVHNSVVSMYKYMFINVPIIDSIVVYFLFILVSRKKMGFSEKSPVWRWCNNSVSYVTIRQVLEGTSSHVLTISHLFFSGAIALSSTDGFDTCKSDWESHHLAVFIINRRLGTSGPQV